MKLRYEQLPSSLQKQLLPVYLVTGDEPLQCGEAADMIRSHARASGYGNREVFFADTAFNWHELTYSADSLSLFSEPRVLDVKMDGAAPGKEGASVLKACVENPAADTLLLISCGKLTAATQKSAWYKAIEKNGVVIQVWPLQGASLHEWLGRRARSRGLLLDEDGVRFLAARVEGNLLAASQEIEKMLILHGEGSLSARQVADDVSDSSRFDVFELVDAALSSKPKRAVRILHNLMQEGIAAPVVLWALAREIRLLAGLKADQEKGIAGDSLFKRHGVWDRRRPLLGKALQRFSRDRLERLLCLGARTDRVIKGQDKGDAWLLLESMAVQLAGTTLVITD